MWVGNIFYSSNICFTGAINPVGAACVVWGCRVWCGSGADTSALGKALPSRSRHAQHTAFMASRKTTWCLFPQAFRGYTQQSSGMYKRMTDTASHSSQTTLFQSISAVFLSRNSEVSTASIQVHPPGTVSKFFNQQWARSISGEEIQKCFFLLTCPNVAVLFHTRNSVPAVQAQCFISGHMPSRRTVDCTTDNKQHLVSSMEHVPRGIFTWLCTPLQSG